MPFAPPLKHSEYPTSHHMTVVMPSEAKLWIIRPTNPPQKNARPGVINITRLAASSMKPVFASLIMFASFRDRRE